MFFMPIDLFSPWIKGREYAIDRNWNDMNQSNQVQRGWLDNDRRQLDNWFAEDTYGDKLASSNATARINQNTATGSDLDTQNALFRQPGRLAQTKSQSDYAMALSGGMEPYLPQIANNQVQANVGQSAANAAQGMVAAQYAPQLYAGNAQNQLATQQYNQAVMGNQLNNMQTDNQMQALANQVRTRQLEAMLNGQVPLFPNQGGAGTGTPAATPGAAPATSGQPTALDFQNVINRIPAGTESQITVGGQQYTAGQDANGGMYIIANGQRHYIGGQQAAPAPANTFSFGG